MEKEKLYLEIINILSDGVYFVDTNRRITFWSKSAEDITGYKEDEIVGKCCQDNLLNHVDKDGRPLCFFGCPLYATMIDGNQRKAEVLLRHKEGHRIPITVNIFPITDEGEIIGAAEIFTPKSPIVYEDDVIERLSNSAMNDQLTGLANRKKIETYLEYKLLEMKQFHNKICIAFLDIDDFDIFNTKYGYENGDSVLVSISKSITHIVKKDDLLGRWGGEEFIGIFGIKNDYEATLMAEKMRILVSKSEIPYENETISVTASLGATVVRENDTIESIIKRMYSLMNQSKQKNRNCVTTDV